MSNPETSATETQLLKTIEESAGLAVNMQEQIMGISVDKASEIDEMSYEELKELAWTDQIQ